MSTEHKSIEEILVRAQKEIRNIIGSDVTLRVFYECDDYSVRRLSGYLCGICEIWGISLEDLKPRSRKRELVTMRQILCFAASIRFPEVGLRIKGELLGGRDHTTIIYSKDAAKDLLEVNDPTFMSYYNPVKHLIYVE